MQINERCPLSSECGKQPCEYAQREIECSYYNANARPGAEIADQEMLRWQGIDGAEVTEAISTTAGQRIRAARNRAGLTQADLASRLGIPYQSIGQWERDVRNPKYETLQRIADALGTPLSSLLGDPEISQVQIDVNKNGGLVYLPVGKLHPHPDNPRKDLGDLTELADSIKANGILQNLTVVPLVNVDPDSTIDLGDDHYTVIIGHRRLAAAKMAGMTEAPCVIADMDQREQVQTVLMENMQRSDLTVYEQAHGFQMMLDLGDTVEQIAQKSGFSATTVRRRVKLLDLDPKEFKKSEERGATLYDYMELDKVNDHGEKNKLLKAIGTPDFKAKLEKVLAEQKKAARIAYIEETLSTFAKKMDSVEGTEWTYVMGPDFWSDKPIEIPEDANTREYAFVIQPWGSRLYRKKEKADLDAEAEREAKWREDSDRRKARGAAVKEISDRCQKLRRDFVMGLSATACKKLMPVVAARLLISSVFYDFSIVSDDLKLLCPSLNTDDDLDPEVLTINKITEALGNAEQAMVRLAYLSAEPGDGYFRSWGEYDYRENEPLDMCYDFLIKLGYEMSEEEKAFQNGTHEIFGGGNAEQKSDPCAACKSAHPECDKCCAVCEDKCNAGQRCQKKANAGGEA